VGDSWELSILASVISLPAEVSHICQAIPVNSNGSMII